MVSSMQNTFMLSVLMPQDLSIFKLNVKATIKLNMEKKIIWIIAYRANRCEVEKLQRELKDLRLNFSSKMRFIVYGLESSTDVSNQLHEHSYEHGYLINYAIKQTKLESGNLIVIDPDFVFFKSNWINNIIEYYNLNFDFLAGTSWDPARLKDCIDFPAPHFMILPTHRSAKLDFTPKNKKRVILNSKSWINYFRWINQRIETGSKLQARNKILMIWIYKFEICVYFYLNYLFPNSSFSSLNYLFSKIKKLQLYSGVLLEHSYSKRAKKAIKIITQVKFWYLNPNAIYRYLILLRGKSEFLNVSAEFFNSDLEFLNLNGEKVAVHARSFGSNYNSTTYVERFLDQNVFSLHK